ncbi:MAG: SDR family NAD(P)-dependent oxidoreductase [Lachnospiraceae bacterium]|jgi:3-oxoacyl-[acyl-carrier protein] reductase|nr:SDR family NAD(P)-dependent oxidoreductase [Lachnospiraceae bacterium]
MNKTALITGASRGIGEAVALLLAAHGYDLYLTALTNKDLLEQVATKATTCYDIKATAFLCDGADAAAVAVLFAQLPRLDVLVNNAGVAYYGLLQEMAEDEWRRVIDANLSSAFYMCKAAIPAMVAAKTGKIVNISSVWGECGASMEVAYSAAKAGLNGFTRALAKELAPSNIQLNALALGIITTDMNERLAPAERDKITGDIPSGRFGSPEEAAAMVWQIINAPAYLTGQVIRLDGGWM